MFVSQYKAEILEGPTTRLKPLGRLARRNNFNAMETIHRTINEAIAVREEIYAILLMDPDEAVKQHLIKALRGSDRVVKLANDTRAHLINNAEIFQQAAKRGSYPKDGH